MRRFLCMLFAALGVSMVLAACSGTGTPQVYHTQAEATLMATPPMYVFQPNLIVTFSCPKGDAKPSVKVRVLGKQPKGYLWQRAISINPPQFLDDSCTTLYSVNKPRVPWIGSYEKFHSPTDGTLISAFYAADSEGKVSDGGPVSLYQTYGGFDVNPDDEFREKVLLLQTNELPPGPASLHVAGNGDNRDGSAIIKPLYPYLPASLRD